MTPSPCQHRLAVNGLAIWITCFSLRFIRPLDTTWLTPGQWAANSSTQARSGPRNLLISAKPNYRTRIPHDSRAWGRRARYGHLTCEAPR
jgi:hypothetical protein